VLYTINSNSPITHIPNFPCYFTFEEYMDYCFFTYLTHNKMSSYTYFLHQSIYDANYPLKLFYFASLFNQSIVLREVLLVFITCHMSLNLPSSSHCIVPYMETLLYTILLFISPPQPFILPIPI